MGATRSDGRSRVHALSTPHPALVATDALLLSLAPAALAHAQSRDIVPMLDDFGTGLSSFAYLRDLPVEFLKIDGAFIHDIEHDRVACSVVRSINEIGHVLGKQTIAEYVTSDAIAQLLVAIGVDHLPGFGIGRPVPLLSVLDDASPARGLAHA